MIIFRWLHTIYAVIIFTVSFIMVFPFFVLFAQKDSWNKYAYKLTQAWSNFFFPAIGIRVKIKDHNEEKWPKPCVYVANHFSFSDIAAFPMIANDACFVGKQSIEKAPLFGYFFTSLHITVNRESMRDRAKVIEKNIDAINNGKSLFIFPEGGIRSTDIPKQVSYKDGAFRTAIKMGVPIVPVTFLNNWRFFPDDGKFLLRSNKLNIVVHKAINTSDLKEADVATLRDMSFNIIEKELFDFNKEYTH